MSPRPVLPTNRTTRNALAALAGLAALKAVGLVLLMGALARALAGFAAGAAPDANALLVQGGIGAIILGGSVWGGQVLARRAALGTKEELRADLIRHRLGHGAQGAGQGAGNVGADSMLASRGLDGLDNYFTAYLPALVTCAVLPALIGLQILISDWVSALIVVLTVPLVPVFMVLIGFHTQERVEQAAAGLDRLSNHLLELARGLPVLVGLRRANAQRQALADVTESYRSSTMKTLRTAFLSAMALELISTISVAVVAVFIGVRLVAGDMPLEAGLLALMLAPECFRPLRDLGAAHHGSEDGVEALRRVQEILAGAVRPAAAQLPAKNDAGAPALCAAHLSVNYPGRTEPALSDFSAELPRGGVLVLDTVSGTGKSTALAAIAGTLPADAVLTGELHAPGSDRTVWVPQHPVFTEDTVAAEIALYAGGPTRLPVSRLDIEAALAHVNGAALADRTPLECSPGELRRVAVARALARIAVDPTVELALIDEPTAHLDPVSAQAVRTALGKIVGSVALIVATHDRLLVGTLNGSEGAEAGAGVGQASLRDATLSETALSETTPADTTPAEIKQAALDVETLQEQPFQWRWLKQLPWRSPRFAAGVLVAALATLSAAALSGISGWLIVWAAAQPPILYLLTLIVGVRAFGIGRSVLRYCERLLTHDAIFRWAGELRLKLWDALGANVRHWGKLTRSGGALGTLVADVDELRDAMPRAVVPMPAALISYGAILLTIQLMLPMATPVVLVLGVLGFILVPGLVLRGQRRAVAAASIHRSWLVSRVTNLFGAADQLSANGVGRVQADAFIARDKAVAAPQRRMAWVSGFGQGSVSVLTSLAAVAVAGLAIGAGVDPRAAAVGALLMLTLAEPLSQFVDAVSELPVLATMMKRTMPILDTPRTVTETGEASPEAVTSLTFTNVTARYPDAASSVFDGISGTTRRGEWLAVTGPSGSGKSTLLAMLLGFLQPERGSYTLNDAPANTGSLAHIAWCPQDSYLFNSTLRANLALARPATEAPSDAELTVALHTVGLGAWFDALPQGLDTRVGAGGHELSGGQRTRVSVARTLVAGADVVLLDEPTAHLGEDEASALIADLRVALSGAAVVLVTHDADLAAVGDSQLVLGESAAHATV